MPRTHHSTPTAPETMWLGHGRHLGPEPEQHVRRNLIALHAAGVIDGYRDLTPTEAASATVGGLLDPFDGQPSESEAAPAEGEPPAGVLAEDRAIGDDEVVPVLDGSARQVFEARWRAGDAEVTVRAQLITYDAPHRRKNGEAVTWVLIAEAEQPWDLEWPSPATMFWPDSERAEWDHDVVPGPRLRATHRLPEDDKEMRKLLKDCVRESWNIHVVLHEAMTPDAGGRRPLATFLPPGLRHRVVEHRAAPEQSQIVNWALKDLRLQVPRGGALVLPTVPGREGYDAERFTVRNLFLDGSEPAELIWRITAFAALPQPMGPEAVAALRFLRRRWHLLTPEEELARARRIAAGYAAELDAVTASRDHYRAEAEQARKALAAAGGALPEAPQGAGQGGRGEDSPLGAITQVFGRLRGGTKRPPQQ